MPTTLGRRAGNDAIAKLVGQHALNEAALAEEILPEPGSHSAALRDFGNYVAGRGQDDPRIYAMWRVTARSGDSDNYTPGENQASLFGRLGSGRRGKTSPAG